MSQPIPVNKRLADIKLILKDLLKVIKVVALYPEGNPLPQSLRRSFSEKLASIVEEHGEIKLLVEADKLLFDKEVVFTDASKEESLAGLFFENGITSLTFNSPLDILDIYLMLDVLKNYQNKAGLGADLASLLWEANLAAIKIATVEDVSLAGYEGDFRVQEILVSGQERSSKERESGYDAIFTDEKTDSDSDSGGILVELPDDVTDDEIRQLHELAAQSASSGSGPIETGTIDGRELVNRFRKSRQSSAAFFLVDSGEQGDMSASGEAGVDSSELKVAEAAEAMGYGDLMRAPMRAVNTALILKDEFKLTEEEEQDIRVMLQEDAKFDMFESTMELLKEMLLQESELNAFFETVGICDKLIGEFVSTGRLIEAGRMLSYLRELEEKLAESKPLWSERLRDSRITAGSASRMKQFSEALNQHSHISAYDIRSYLDAFGWEALGPITDVLGDLEHRIHRELLCDLLSAEGKDNIAIIAKGVHDKRWFVVRNSVNILARMNDDKALGYLAPALKHEDRRVRLEVLSAIKDRTDTRVMDILRKALLDKDAEVRQIALTHLMTHPIDGSFEAVSTMIGDAAFQSLERPEQADVLKAYSILGSERAVPFLKKLATRMNTFNDVQLSFLRTAAFTALAHNPSRTAESLLVRLRSSWSPRIRRCAREAIGHRREIMVRQAVHPSGVDLKQDSSEAAHVR